MTSSSPGSKGDFFPDVPDMVPFEGADTKNRLAFRYYDEAQVVTIGAHTQSMKDWLRFSVVYWHTFRAKGSDPFGGQTLFRPWDDGSGSLESDSMVARAAAEFVRKIGAPFYAFHDRDLATEQATLRETNARLDKVVAVLKAEMGDAKPLWGTQSLFGHQRYANGAFTNPDRLIAEHALAQTLKCMEVTVELGGNQQNFWGGREGYQTLLNTDMPRELDQLAASLHYVVDYGKKIGIKHWLIEPKPKEPTKHQYDSDVASCLQFLRRYDLHETFKLNPETNHATLAGHSMEHELVAAGSQGALGSIDANTGDLLLGWDVDLFAKERPLCTDIMRRILEFCPGGLNPGGINFDAKVQREDLDPIDLFYAHIASMDAFALALLTVSDMYADDWPHAEVASRYESWSCKEGQEFLTRTTPLATIRARAEERGEVNTLTSARRERFEFDYSRYLDGRPRGAKVVS